MTGRIWPDATVAKVREMREAGFTFQAIAKEVGRTPAQVDNLCGNRGIYLRGNNPNLISSRWTKDNDAELLRMVKNGVTLADIAAQTGRTYAGVAGRLNKLQPSSGPVDLRPSITRAAGQRMIKALADYHAARGQAVPDFRNNAGAL